MQHYTVVGAYRTDNFRERSLRRNIYGLRGCLFTKDTSYIVTYLFSRDINIPSCSGIVVACEVRLSRLTEPVPVHCQCGCVAQCSTLPRWWLRVRIPRTYCFCCLFFLFLFFFIHPFKSVFHLFSNIKPLRLPFTCFSSFLLRSFHWT